ncbi:MAG: cell envelope protein SmpA [Rhodobacterales bacterium]|nr:MAG: cell envelope protein SmpA [Rhodobacterales bacterium]
MSKTAGNFPKTVRRMVAVALIAGAAVACSPVQTYHGFIPTDADLEELMVGVDTRTTVASIIGKPAASGLRAESAWYYVMSEFTTRGGFAPEETNREVVAISFDDEGVVSNVERFGLEDGRVVVLSRRVTESNIEGLGFLRQLFGNLSGAANFAERFQR